MTLGLGLSGALLPSASHLMPPHRIAFPVLGLLERKTKLETNRRCRNNLLNPRSSLLYILSREIRRPSLQRKRAHPFLLQRRVWRVPNSNAFRPFQFMFKLFKWHQTILYSIVGTLDAFLGRYALRLFYLPLSAALIGCSAIGYFLLARPPGSAIARLLRLAALGPMAFFMGILIHSKTVFDWRLVAHLFPFMVYAAVEGFTALMGWGEDS